MTTAPDFWNHLAEKYARQPISDEAAYQHKLAETRKRLATDMNVLEFGCGTGGTAICHAPAVNSYRAIDYSKQMINIALEKAEAENIENLSFEVESINTLEAKDESYDAILGMSILHLLSNRSDVMGKVFRLLKPGGYFFSSTVCIGDGNPIVPLVLPIMKAIGKAPYVGIFKGDELTTEMKQAGFLIEEQWRPKKSAALFVVARKA